MKRFCWAVAALVFVNTEPLLFEYRMGEEGAYAEPGEQVPNPASFFQDHQGDDKSGSNLTFGPEMQGKTAGVSKESESFAQKLDFEFRRQLKAFLASYTSSLEQSLMAFEKIDYSLPEITLKRCSDEETHNSLVTTNKPNSQALDNLIFIGTSADRNKLWLRDQVLFWEVDNSGKLKNSLLGPLLKERGVDCFPTLLLSDDSMGKISGVSVFSFGGG